MSPLLADLRAADRANRLLDRATLARLARTRRHRALVTDAESAIREFLEVAHQPYLALSGGKDSAVCLALAAPIAHARHIPLIACWSDDELEHEAQRTYLPALCAALDTPLLIWCSHATHAGWFTAWRDAPYWCAPHPERQNQPGPSNIGGRAGMRALGYDGVILGLRAEESSYRRINAAMRGRVYQRVAGDWCAQPIARWRVEDVWAALLDRGVPTNPIYDQLAAAGVPLERQRVGPLPLDDGRTLAVAWPDLYRRLVTRYGDRW